MIVKVGKEYIFVPRPNDGSMDDLHGATFVPLHRLTQNMYIGEMRGGHFMAFADELLPPGVADED